METSPGVMMAKLLLTGFTTLVDEVVTELERQGHPGVTATHAFALEAIDDGAQSASDLGRSLGVSKQAAAKTIAALEGLQYVTRLTEPGDARRKRLMVTDRGRDMLATGTKMFDVQRARLVGQVGARELETLERVLTTLTSPQSARGQ